MKIQAIAAIAVIFCGLSVFQANGATIVNHWQPAEYCEMEHRWQGGYVYKPSAGSKYTNFNVNVGPYCLAIDSYEGNLNRMQIKNHCAKANYLIKDNTLPNRYLEHHINNGDTHVVEGSDLRIWVSSR